MLASAERAAQRAARRDREGAALLTGSGGASVPAAASGGAAAGAGAEPKGLARGGGGGLRIVRRNDSAHEGDEGRQGCGAAAGRKGGDAPSVAAPQQPLPCGAVAVIASVCGALPLLPPAAQLGPSHPIPTTSLDACEAEGPRAPAAAAAAKRGPRLLPGLRAVGGLLGGSARLLLRAGGR